MYIYIYIYISSSFENSKMNFKKNESHTTFLKIEALNQLIK